MNNLLLSTSSLKFHHLGVACRDIEKEFSIWAQLGYRPEGTTFVDKTQGVKGLFLRGTGPRLELLEDLPGHKTVAPWLERGVKIYHTAFQVREIRKEIDFLTQNRARVVTPLVPACAFNGCLITFLMLKNLALIELIELT